MSLLFPKMRKPRGFNYQPMYWDPEKERKEERLKRIKKEMGMLPEGEDYNPEKLRGAFTGEIFKRRRESQRKSNLTLILLIILLIGIAYFLYA